MEKSSFTGLLNWVIVYTNSYAGPENIALNNVVSGYRIYENVGRVERKLNLKCSKREVIVAIKTNQMYVKLQYRWNWEKHTRNLDNCSIKVYVLSCHFTWAPELQKE